MDLAAALRMHGHPFDKVLLSFSAGHKLQELLSAHIHAWLWLWGLALFPH